MTKKHKNFPKNKEDIYEWGRHPNSLKALKKNQWKVGESGNVKGSPKKYERFSEELSKFKDMKKEELYDMFDEEITAKEVVHRQIWKMAGRGNEKMINILINLGCLEA